MSDQLEQLKAFRDTPTGEFLVDLFERQMDEIADSRNWEPGESKESAAMACRQFKNLIRVLKPVTKATAENRNQFI